MPRQDKKLLKELKDVYKKYNEGNTESFDESLERIVIEFGSNLKMISKRIEKFIKEETV